MTVPLFPGPTISKRYTTLLDATAPRITAELDERYQISVNRKTVAKRMRLVGIML
ncbi:hypothetical protein GWO69_05865 [Corynebacterium macginleyi]|uniref:IS3 family transposase n=1 Tax=Corynebacterium macginleyi TaxID=38290 RepID=UPI00190CD0E8|nr:IS3 family transposase [Corynebacterium macginleyi]MBK4156964.1 hypothetical protein [Corynebacterium macginleyi]